MIYIVFTDEEGTLRAVQARTVTSGKRSLGDLVEAGATAQALLDLTNGVLSWAGPAERRVSVAEVSSAVQLPASYVFRHINEVQV